MRKMTLIATLIAIVLSSTGMIHAQKIQTKVLKLKLKCFLLHKKVSNKCI